MPSKAVFPVIAEVNTSPSVRNAVTSVTPEAKARAVKARSMMAMRSLQEPTSVIASLLNRG
jgi:predicted nucleic acid-binding Zn ribbon protein